MWKTKRTVQRNTFPISFLLTWILVVAVQASAKEENHDSPLKPVRFELVHRHDPRLPGNENLKLDKYEAIRDRALRDVARKNRSTDSKMAQMLMSSGWDLKTSGYFVQVRVGTPSQNFWLIVDTGSELTWIRCNDKQNSPIQDLTRRSTLRSEEEGQFLRWHSSTYKPVTCGDPRCKSDEFINMFADPQCESPTDLCPYVYKYEDGTTARGYFGTDVVTLGMEEEKKGTVNDVVIGCTKEMASSRGEETLNHTNGVLGLSHNPNSFISRATQHYGNKFSYCLMDHTLHKNVTNYLTFGAYKITQTPNSNLLAPMKRAELVLVEGGGYGVKVEGISIGDQMLPIPPEFWDFKAGGGLVIDSGSSLTSLGSAAFQMVNEALWKTLAPKYKRKTEGIEPFAYCIDAGENEFESDVSKLAIHFTGGAIYEPPVSNYIIPAEPRVQCIGIDEYASVDGGAVLGGLLGNIMQQNALWEFDLAKNTVGFAPSKCS